MAELKPCPFCGGKAKYSERQMRWYGTNWLGERKIKFGGQVICQRCHARGSLFSRTAITPREYGATTSWLYDRATEAWNRRAEHG